MQHFLQSDAWRAFQEALGRKTFVKNGSAGSSNWQYLAVLETGTGNRRLYCPYGPECASQAAFEAALASLKELASEQRADFIRLEPTGAVTADDMRAHGFRKVTYNQLQPEHTQIIQLAGRTADEILGDMASSTRNRYRTYAKKGIVMHESTKPEDVELFLRFIKKVANRTHLTPHSDAYFRTQAETLFPLGAGKLFYATVDGVPAAASIAFEGPLVRSYAHAAADDDYRKLAPGTALVAYMIMNAHAAGKERYDLYGIAPGDDPNHPWAGFTRFKQQFGGQPLSYIGAWDLPCRPVRYHAYRAYQSARRQLKKRAHH